MPGNREIRERDAGRPGRDAVGGLPVLRPCREVAIGETEHRLPDLEFVQRPIVQDLRERPEVLVVVFLVGARRRRMILVAEHEWLEGPPPGNLAPDSRPGRQPLVDPRAALLLVVRAIQCDIERGIRCVPDAGSRFALVFVVDEEMQLVLHDRTAKGSAVLLVVNWLDNVQDWILRVEAAVAKITSKQA